MLLKTAILGCLALLAAALLSQLVPQKAAATGLADCPVVSDSVLGNTFYIDAVNGSEQGDGSRARPWRDLQSLVRDGKLSRQMWRMGPAPAATDADRTERRLARKNVQQNDEGKPEQSGVPRLVERTGALVGDGDTILLMSGNYGSVDLSGLYNKSFVKIAAAAGQHPRLDRLTVRGASHFVIEGLAIGGAPVAQDKERPLILVSKSRGVDADNIRLRKLDVGSTIDAQSIAPEQFAASGPKGVSLTGNCIELFDSQVHDVRVGVVAADLVRADIRANRISRFSIDGVDFSGRNLFIIDNEVVDHIPPGDKHHPDCMQGQTRPGDGLQGPVTISGNVCLVKSGSMPTVADQMQGIVIFNGEWQQVSITCNIVAPLAWQGIAMMGVDKSRIEHNVLLGQAGLVEGLDPKLQPWILIGVNERKGPTKLGRMPTNSEIRANLAPSYRNDPKGTAVGSKGVTGVRFADNAVGVIAGTKVASDQHPALSKVALPGPLFPVALADIRARYPLPAACKR